MSSTAAIPPPPISASPGDLVMVVEVCFADLINQRTRGEPNYLELAATAEALKTALTAWLELSAPAIAAAVLAYQARNQPPQ